MTEPRHGRRFRILLDDGTESGDLFAHGYEFPTGTVVVEPVAERVGGVLPYEDLDAAEGLFERFHPSAEGEVLFEFEDPESEAPRDGGVEA